MTKEEYQRLIAPLTPETRRMMEQEIRRHYRIPPDWELGDPLPEQSAQVKDKKHKRS